MSKKILLVFGTCPEAIKMAPLVRTLQAQDAFQVKVCVSAQHRPLLDQVLQLFDIQPDFELDLRQSGQDLCDITRAALRGFKPVLKHWRPDALLVHGDSATSFAAALAAFYQHIPVGHVEAGLRTGQLYSPWPEEAHRKLTAALAHWHFAPTATNRANLLREGVAPGTIHVTGNTVVDALLQVRGEILGNAPLQQQFEQDFSFLQPHKRLVLVTCHQRDTSAQGLENICQALARIARRHADVQLVYALPPNPQVQESVRRLLGGVADVRLLAPLDYLPFVYLMDKSTLILTDSGGIQEEAPTLDKPVLLMRETTERPEALAAGTVRLVGIDPDEIATQASVLLTQPQTYRAMAFAPNPYGDGHACERIAQALRGDKRLFLLPPRCQPQHGTPALLTPHAPPP